MLKSFDRDTPSDIISAALLEDGGVIVLNQADDELMDRVSQELREPLDAKGQAFENDFNGYKTLRLGGILEVSRSSAELMAQTKFPLIATSQTVPRSSM